MKLTHIERMVYWFRMHEGKATLAEILKSGEAWSYEFRARMTDARKKGIQFVCHRGQTPSLNEYRLVFYESNGQGRLL